MRWKTLSGNVYSDTISFVKNNFNFKEIIIGSDSQPHRTQTIYSTVCVLLFKNGGGIAAYKKSIIKRKMSIRERLLKETYLSLEEALKIKDNLKLISKIHLDVSKRKENASNKYLKELTGIINGTGFKFEAKPNSWVAGTIADKTTKKTWKLKNGSGN